ncbi:methyl-accepting chemotaxis protein [Bacillota bacterium Lsc_1132]
MKKLFTSISFKLLLSIAVIIFLISSLIGTLSYNFAKKELVNSGKLDLQHIVNTAIPTLDLLNKEVEAGNLTLKEAQEQAREILIGPATVQGNSKSYDFSKSKFLYKKQGYLFAYDEKGKVEMHPTIPYGENKYDLKNSSGDYVIRDILKAAIAKNPDEHYYTYSWKNPGETKEREKMAYVVHYKPWGWNIGIGAYTDEFYESLKIVKLLIALVSIAVASVSLLAFYFMTKRKLKLLHKISDTSLKIASGELMTSEFPESDDEIGKLGAAFNIMVKELRGMMTGLQETSVRLLESSSDLAAISEETTAGSEEVSTAMGQISASTVSQSEDIENTSKLMELMTESIQKINQESRAILEITNGSKQATEHGKNIVSVLKKANSETEKASENISIGITNLFAKIQDISHITEAIQHITKQTNLLALNASIEAARAGEHGKGFAVVADEVRKLAEESNAATKKIQEMIEGIEKETETTVLYMAETANIGQQLNESVVKTEQEFVSIEHAVAQTIAAVEKLNAEIQSVTSENDKIMTFIQNISAIAQQTAAASEEVTSSIDEQVRAVSNVSTAADGLSSLSEELNQIIGKYKFS